MGLLLTLKLNPVALSDNFPLMTLFFGTPCIYLYIDLYFFRPTGFDTTSSTLSVVVHGLMHHPEVQEKVRKEIEVRSY